MIDLVSSFGVISTTEVLIASVVFSVIFLFIKNTRKNVPEGTKPVPGPMPLPLIGNLLSLGKNPHLSLTKMSETYGDVLQIQIGTKPVLVLSGLETLRQALLKKGDVFNARPDLFTFRLVGDGQSLTFSQDSGEVWHARRRLAHNSLKTFAISPSLAYSGRTLVEDHISKEADYLLRKFQQLIEEKGEFDPFRYVVVSVANVICAMCFGKRYSHEDQEFLDIVNLTNEFGAAAASGNPADFIPILQYLPSRTMKNFIEINKKFTGFTQKNVKEHYRTLDNNSIRDITDSLIQHSQERKLDENLNVQLTEQKIVNIVNDLFGAGFDTITTALSWCLIYLVANPEIQEKIQKELDQVIGRERRPKFSDRAQLPYTEAFILEMFRHSSFLPFTIPHCTTSDTVLNGYFIPKGLCVLINQWQVNHDPTLWKDPFSFCPERFLNEDGSSINKIETEKVLIFGLGKRRCVGEAIGRMEVFLFLTILLQQMQFSKQEGQKLDMSPTYGLTMKHKRYLLTAKLRFPMMATD
ncbi:cytochrome P450 1A1-like [Hyla sarda]|uniref:cytochrome P450 1A1-like n=1 Tax=Hyla sarda TaxID=327740 RepID=UPI0024C37174|nr:cytochrome P450 1A1-like [Hyla sarda]XP_056409692.1 cytochrome P450 1A1-like [Hyla sarda]